MKVYIPYLQNPDTYEYDQPLGVFDSIEKCRKEIEHFANEIGVDYKEINFEISDFILNRNILISANHTMK